MRILTAIACTLFATTLFAGATYDFQSASAGVQPQTLAGKVAVEGNNIRFDVTSGEDLLFKTKSFILSTDGGRTLSVFDPSLKTYYVMNLSAMSANAFGGMMKLNFSNPRVATRDIGDGGAVSGYPTRRSAVDASFDIAADALGGAMTTHMTMTTESWTTDQLSGDFTNFLQMKSLQTGYDELDKLIEAQSKALRGRFPLKQVTTIRVKQGENDITETTTSEVTNIEKKAIPATTFATPSGYTKVDDPITRMMKTLK